MQRLFTRAALAAAITLSHGASQPPPQDEAAALRAELDPRAAPSRRVSMRSTRRPLAPRACFVRGAMRGALQTDRLEASRAASSA